VRRRCIYRGTFPRWYFFKNLMKEDEDINHHQREWPVILHAAQTTAVVSQKKVMAKHASRRCKASLKSTYSARSLDSHAFDVVVAGPLQFGRKKSRLFVKACLVFSTLDRNCTSHPQIYQLKLSKNERARISCGAQNPMIDYANGLAVQRHKRRSSQWSRCSFYSKAYDNNLEIHG